MNVPVNNDLLRAILLNPDDDGPRLVFADWLDEHGDPDRAVYIRDAINRRNGPVRVNDRIRKSSWYQNYDWLGGVLCSDVAMLYERGFVHFLEIPMVLFLRFARTLFELHPLTSVELCDQEPMQLPTHRPRWIWESWGDHPRDEPHLLPIELFQAFDSPLMRSDRENPYIEFETRLVAKIELNRACVKYGRIAAGLPLLPQAQTIWPTLFKT